MCVAVAAFVAAWPSCDGLDRPAQRPVLSIGSHDIFPEEWRAQRKRMGLDPGGVMKEPLDSFVQRVVDHFLVLEYGKEQGVFVTDEELESEVRAIRKDYAEKDFEDLLLKAFVDYAEWKEALREQILVKKIMAKVSEACPQASMEEIKAYYASHPEQFRRPAMVQFRQIVARTREEAESLHKKVVQGGGLAAAVVQSAKVPDSAGGPDRGWFAKGDLDESMEKVLFSLPVGQVSGVVETPYGFHIFEVLGRRPAGVRSLPDAMEEIEAGLRGDKLEAFYLDWIQERRKTVPVKIDHELLKKLELE